MRDFWQRLQRGVEVAVAGPTPDKHLGVRDGFLRFFRERLDRPVSIAVVPQDEAVAPKGLPVSDEEVIGLVRRRIAALAERLGDQYDFLVASEGGLHSLEVGGEKRHFVRNWTVVSSPLGEAWGSSGSVQLPASLLEGRGAEEIPFAVPGTRRRGGMIASLTGGIETRRRAVEVATIHALSSLFYGRLGPDRLSGD